MNNKWLKLALMASFCSLSLNYCGGSTSSSGNTPDPDPVVTTPSQDLSNGDIAAAQDKYDTKLGENPDDTNSAFGAALARLLQLPETTPTNKILDNLGQPRAKTNQTLGANGYLSALNKINEVSLTLTGANGPYFGVTTSRSFQFTHQDATFKGQSRQALLDKKIDLQNQIAALPSGSASIPPLQNQINVINSQLNSISTINCSYDEIEIETYNPKDAVHLFVAVYPKLIVKKDGNVIENYQMQVGDILQANKVERDYCTTSSLYLSGYFGTTKTNRKQIYAPSASGGVKVTAIGGSPNSIELQFQNLAMGNSVTLNGILGDEITEKVPDPANYYPFTQKFNDDTNKVRNILHRAIATLTTDDLQGNVIEYVPLFEKISELLAQADQNNNFQFMIPAGLFFGLNDVPVNRTDLKIIRAGIDFALAGLYFSDSWEMPFSLGQLYDSAGNQTMSQQDILDELNQFFDLKPDHLLNLAQTRIIDGLERLVETKDAFDSVTLDGIVEKTVQTNAGYAELDDLVHLLKNSLTASQAIVYVDPIINLNLNNFFIFPPDAANIDFDPFVIENGRIRPVEAFFEEILDGSADINTSYSYKASFTQVDQIFSQALLDEFVDFSIAGRIIFRSL